MAEMRKEENMVTSRPRKKENPGTERRYSEPEAQASLRIAWTGERTMTQDRRWLQCPGPSVAF